MAKKTIQTFIATDSTGKFGALLSKAAVASLVGNINDNFTEVYDKASAVANAVTGGSYNTTTKKIVLTDSGKNSVAEIDCTDFIKDGMISNVEVKNGNLVVTFNTDAGKEPISIPLTNIFNPADYYTKTDVDTELAKKQDTISDLATIRSGADKGATALQPADIADWAKAATKPSYALSELTADATHRLVTDTEKNTWNGKTDLTTVQGYYNSGNATVNIGNVTAGSAFATHGNVNIALDNTDSTLAITDGGNNSISLAKENKGFVVSGAFRQEESDDHGTSVALKGGDVKLYNADGSGTEISLRAKIADYESRIAALENTLAQLVAVQD